ncbi:hypothetical protein PPYR_04882 [Photinus pyralis]|uniref:Major facilitator superfamily (MFS) profile domain-containing protein n=1 Tax=Photinus pyralis TaxID=7054 RepID=A0A1Y1M8H8_PHOPY|nr:facilitated trehalose transporter Tret1-like [Photinus pyralis]XP_031355319.1 facilitated trehalose transporter Tret1-like [Photinus pyralis]KAB0793557.1 hypothetical protein PPYR_13177 [Photinus pyralis]KAB0802696.1 hypothetical protein PPYR_04882 [Photinus pyralis]
MNECANNLEIIEKPDVNFRRRRIIGRLRQFLAIVCLGPLSLGSSLSWTSPVLPQLLEQNSTNLTYHRANFTLSIDEGSWIGSMLAIGVLISAIPSGYLAGRYGLKKSTIALVIPNLLFTMLVLFASDVYTLCVGRLLSGMATGGISVVGPMYISEIAEVSLRGTLGSFFEFLIYFGVVFVAVCGAYVSYTTLTIILGAVALVLGFIFCFLPESPAYLIKKNKREQAKTALLFYRGESFNVENALDEIYERVHKETGRKVNVMLEFKSKAVVRGLIASVGLTVFQQLSGIDGVTFYTVYIFQAAETELNEYTSAIILSTVQLLSAVVVIFVIEKAGRKIFLYISASGTCICLAALAAYFHLKLVGITFFGMGAIPLASTMVYACAFSAGLGPVLWMVNGELFSPAVKGIANGITITANWVCLFIITKTMPVMMDDVGPHITFYFYAACMFFCVIFIKFCVPETRGKSLEEIQNELRS